MKNQEQIAAKVLAILISGTEEELLSRMREYLDSLTEPEFEYAQEYAQEFLARRRAAMEEAFRESRH